MRRRYFGVALLLLPTLLTGCGASASGAHPKAPSRTPTPASPPALDPVVARDRLAGQLTTSLAFLAPLRFATADGALQSDCDLPGGGQGRQWLLPEYVAGAVKAPQVLAARVEQHWRAAGQQVERADTGDFYSVQATLPAGSVVFNAGADGQGATLSGQTPCRPSASSPGVSPPTP